MDDKRPIGVSLSADLIDDIEEGLDYGDSRSERIETLILAGLAAERVAEEMGHDLPDSRRGVEGWIRQLAIDSSQ